MAPIGLDKASLVALWVETLLYGAYIVLFAICVHILVHRSRDGVNKPMLATAIAMFSMSTMNVCVALARALTAFIETPEGATFYYAQIWLWESIFKQALYASNNIVADGLVVYRCYIVWGHNWRIIVFPVIMLIATSVCGYLAVWNFSRVKPGDNVFASNIAEWGTALFSLSLATNIIVTTLIAGRIWWIGRAAQAQLGRRHRRKYNNALGIIIESGAIYSVSLMTLLILYCSKSNAQYIVYDALAQIMGIVPTLIIVRVGLGVSTQAVSTYGGSTQIASAPNQFRPKPIPMQVRKVVEVDGDIEADITHHSRSGDDDLYKQPTSF